MLCQFVAVVGENSGRRSKTFWRAIQDFGGSAAQGPLLRRRSEPQRVQCKHHQHVNVSRRALGMRVVIPPFRSSRQYLRQIHRSATTLCLRRLSTSPARHVFQRSMRRPMSHTQYRHCHSQVEEPTIYALSTASGKAAIAVIRISGPACRQV